jgi:group I intron endonuclease
MGIIYEITNTVNGKQYVGQTSLPLSYRMSKHKTRSKQKDSLFYQDIRTFGWEKFTYSVLEEISNDPDKMWEREKFWIQKLQTHITGYNIKGKGTEYIRKKRGPYPEHAKQKHSELHSKEWIIIFPDGSKEKVKNLHQFCRDHNLCGTTMWKIGTNYKNGRYKSHKNYRCTRVERGD